MRKIALEAMIESLREWWFLWRAWRRSRLAHRYLNKYLSGKERAEQKAREAWEDYIDRTPRVSRPIDWDYFDASNRGGEAVRPSKNPPREKP